MPVGERIKAIERRLLGAGTVVVTGYRRSASRDLRADPPPWRYLSAQVVLLSVATRYRDKDDSIGLCGIRGVVFPGYPQWVGCLQDGGLHSSQPGPRSLLGGAAA